MKLSCGPCAEKVLPSLAGFDREFHDALLFDEARLDQVLAFRELFQGNEFLQTLGSSPCNPYAYSIWVYNVPLIVCCNEFNPFAADIPAGDVDWIHKNCRIVQLEKKDVWYLKEHTNDEDDEA